MDQEQNVLCAANSYVEKFYLNQEFQKLPEEVQETLQVIAVTFTEDVGGIFLMRFTEEGTLTLESQASEDDFLYDEIGADLKIKEIRKKYRELFEKLELYYEGMKNIRQAEAATGKSLR